jgi:ADP-ribosylglycohydrolase
LTGAVERWGHGSSVAAVLQLSLHIALSNASYVQAVRDNILAGGDSTARAHVLGALLGARDGYDAIPKRWKSKAIRRLQLEQMLQMLLYQRTAKLAVALEGGA